MSTCDKCKNQAAAIAYIKGNEVLFPNGNDEVTKFNNDLLANIELPLLPCNHTRLCQNESCNWPAQQIIHLHEVDSEAWDIECCLRCAGAWANYRWTEIPK